MSPNKEQTGGTNRCVSGIQLVEETLVPGVDAVLQDLLNHIKKAIFTQALSIRQCEFQPGDEILWLLSVDEDIGGQAISTD
jgi:hypothetical protein